MLLSMVALFRYALASMGDSDCRENRVQRNKSETSKHLKDIPSLQLSATPATVTLAPPPPSKPTHPHTQTPTPLHAPCKTHGRTEPSQYMGQLEANNPPPPAHTSPLKITTGMLGIRMAQGWFVQDELPQGGSTQMPTRGWSSAQGGDHCPRMQPRPAVS